MSDQYSGFKHVHLISSSPDIRGLSIFIRNDCNFSILDCSSFTHPSVEILGVLLYCSLSEPLHIFNIYRHPNANTLLFLQEIIQPFFNKQICYFSGRL